MTPVRHATPNEVLVLSGNELESLLSLEAVIDRVEVAFSALARGDDQLFPVVRESLKGQQAVFGVKSAHLVGRGIVGLKAAGYWAENFKAGLQGHQGIILLLNATTGKPSLICDGNVVTRMRTAAAGAIALRYLARPDAKRVAIIGAGVQALGQARAAVSALPDLEEIGVYDMRPEALAGFRRALEAIWGGPLRSCASAADAVIGSDVVITCTPSTVPLILSEWIAPGVHISAIGADTHGKQELDPLLVSRSKLVVDDVGQAFELGESQHAFRLGLIAATDVYAELGELTAGLKLGRTSESEVTVFDATGVALQDVATASLAFDRAVASGVGQWVTI